MRTGVMTVLLVASVVVPIVCPVSLGADDGGVVRPRLTVKGQTLDRAIRIGPGAPFILYDSSRVSRGRNVTTMGQLPSAGQRRGGRTTKMLVGGAIGGSVGAFLGLTACNQRGGDCDYPVWGGLVGVGIGVGIGALIGN